MKYPVVNDGDIVVPVMKGYRMRCCDCDLVHRVNFTVRKHGRGHKVSFRIWRDNRATAAARRKKK